MAAFDKTNPAEYTPTEALLVLQNLRAHHLDPVPVDTGPERNWIATAQKAISFLLDYIDHQGGPWIPVEDEKPPPRTWVFAVAQVGQTQSVWQLYYNPAEEHSWWGLSGPFTLSGQDIPVTPTCWRHLPKPHGL